MFPPFVTLEEHFLGDLGEDAQRPYSEQLSWIPGLMEKFTDVGPLRLRSMDENNISVQVVSHGPGEVSPGDCRLINDQLAKACKDHPDRFAGFAVLPVYNPEDIAAELTRCVRELGFVGALINNRAGNTYFDGPEYEAMWTAAQDLDVPIYLHPTWPTKEQVSLLYSGNFPPAASESLSSSGWGWHSDVGLHVLRLFAAGIFDKFPRLKIVIGHMGEMIPFMLGRLEALTLRWGDRERNFREVYDTNIWITTSGVWSLDPMATILRNTKIDKILYSVDYPFAKNEDGFVFMRDLEKSGLVDKEQLKRIAYKNAEELLRLRVTKLFDGQ